MPDKKEVKELSKDVKHAIKWAAAEFKYIKELKEELEEIKQEKDIKKEIREISKAIRILRYVGRAERRAAKFEDKVEGDLKEIYKELSTHLEFDFSKKKEIMNLIRELEIEHNALVKYTSTYEGLLKEELTKAEAEAQLLADIGSEEPKKAEKIHRSLMALLNKIQIQVKDAEKWVIALEASLKKAEETMKKLPEEKEEDFLEHIKRLKPSIRGLEELSTTSYAQTVVGNYVYNYLYDCISKTNLEAVKKNLKKYKKEIIDAIGAHRIGSYFENLENKYNLDAILREFFMFYIPLADFAERPANKQDLYRLLIEGKSEGKLPETNPKLIQLMKKYFKNNVVVDLGAGQAKMYFAAVLFGAKEYVAIDVIYGSEGKESPFVIPKRIKLLFKILDHPIKICKAKSIGIDILEGLYTKIPDNSSCFTIFGVDVSYGFSGEYVKLVNKLLAKKTKIKGIVVSVDSVLGTYFPPENFDVLFEQLKGKWMVYLRKK